MTRLNLPEVGKDQDHTKLMICRIWIQLKDHVRPQVEYWVGEEVRIQLEDRIRNQVWGQVGTQVNSRVRNQIEEVLDRGE